MQHHAAKPSSKGTVLSHVMDQLTSPLLIQCFAKTVQTRPQLC